MIRLLQSSTESSNVHLVRVILECSKQTGPWLKTLSVHSLVGKADIALLDQLLTAGASCNRRNITGAGPVHKVCDPSSLAEVQSCLPCDCC